MNILLADDERLIRLGLESMINELYPFEHTFYHAKNGNEVVEQVMLHSPDIVFLDIKMPIKNGLEALEQCKPLSPSTVWIILSGYAEFSYAQKALSLGADHYLLKPIGINDLKALMEDIRNKLHETFTKENAIFSSMVYQAFNLYASMNMADVSILPDSEGQYQVYVFIIDNPIGKTQDIIEHDLYKKIHSFLNDSANNRILHSLFFLNTGELCLITENKAPMKLNAYLRNLVCNEINFGSVTLICQEADTIQELYNMTKDILEFAPLRIVEELEQVIISPPIKEFTKKKDLIAFAKSIEDFSILYYDADLNALNELLADIRNNQVMRKAFRNISRPRLTDYLQNTLDIRISADSFDDLIKQLQTCIYRRCQNVNENSGDLINNIKNYVQSNYNNDISINVIADLFHISPSYLSRLFHQRTGQKYIDYITQLRMEKAKELIAANPDMTVKAVAESVGYSSIRHFSKVFQKYTGELPSCYNDEKKVTVTRIPDERFKVVHKAAKKQYNKNIAVIPASLSGFTHSAYDSTNHSDVFYARFIN